ncbi:MAG: signal recognition particle-docking protein FtsY, partial [Actinomycetota bacterium]|nr:signal recognition particle-docking protein FtsY [Actinomycetota bacterium]
MDSVLVYLVIAALLLVIVVGAGIALVRRRGAATLPRPEAPRPGIDYAPGVGDDDSEPRDTPRRS